MATDAVSPMKRKLLRKQELWNERASWMSHWREISEYQQPRAGRFFVTDRNRGEKRHQAIYDRTPIGSARTLAAGLMSGMTSPARPWFRLTLSDPDLREFGPVKTWLHRTGLLLREIFAASNNYRALQQGYGELGLFGTWATCLLPDFENVIHHYPMTIGEYAVATDYKGQVDTICREWEMTVGQIVSQFGRSKCSASVQNLYDRGNLNSWVPVIHIIEPNAKRDMRKADHAGMRWSSCYFEAQEAGRDGGNFLSESGFKRFACLAPRWDVAGGDIYGSSPGMEALGDVKQLQFSQLRKAQGIDYMVNPPLQVPSTYKEAASKRLPGGIMYYDAAGKSEGIRSAFEVNLNLQHLLGDIEDIRGRIRSAYYEDLFLMLANDTRSGVTATEVAERHEEKLLMLGPVLESLHNEMLQPHIEITFAKMAEARILPPIPQELEGIEINIEFVSTLAQAQRVVSAQGMDRLLATISSIAQGSGDITVWDKIDKDQAIDDYAENYGVNPEVIVPDDKVIEIRAARAKQMQAQQAAASMPAAVDAAQTASQIDTGGLRDVVGMFQGYSAMQ